jgi:hypothetical protein
VRTRSSEALPVEAHLQIATAYFQALISVNVLLRRSVRRLDSLPHRRVADRSPNSRLRH